eukprot:9471474-Pyramimonas_sp.AAC.1
MYLITHVSRTSELRDLNASNQIEPTPSRSVQRRAPSGRIGASTLSGRAATKGLKLRGPPAVRPLSLVAR